MNQLLQPVLVCALFLSYTLQIINMHPNFAHTLTHTHTHTITLDDTAVALGFEIIAHPDRLAEATPSAPPLSSVTSSTTASATSDSDTDSEDLPEGWEERLVSFLAFKLGERAWGPG